QVLVRSWGTVAPKRAFVTGHGARHAQGCVAVKIICSQTELNKFAKRVELFGDKLTGADDTQGFTTVLLLDAAEFLGHRRERVVPIDTGQSASLIAQKWIAGAVGGF